MIETTQKQELSNWRTQNDGGKRTERNWNEKNKNMKKWNLNEKNTCMKTMKLKWGKIKTNL